MRTRSPKGLHISQQVSKIEFTIKAKSKPNYPLTENSQQYKIVKESASQLGFDLEQEKND